MCSYKGRVVRANYNTVNVPSGRLSSGGSSGNPYFIPQNLQNVPKEEERLFLHHHPVIGYVLEEFEEGCVRLKDGTPVKVKTKTGLHRAFIPHDKDWFIMTSDYCLDPDSVVITEHGNMTIRELETMPEGTKVLTPWGYKESYNVRRTGKHKQYKFTLTSGEVLTCSPEHRIMVSRDGITKWIQAQEVQTTDYILTTTDGDPYTFEKQ